MRTALIVLAFLLVWGPHRVWGACPVGDLPCACVGVLGGRWRDLKAPLEPTCTVTIRHQGALAPEILMSSVVWL
jgi:hypothetical protein